MTCSLCPGEVMARGWCHLHYKRWYRNGDPLVLAQRGPKPRPDSMPSRIVDLLETDGGWLTTAGVQAALPGSAAAIQRALFRLRSSGVVISRAGQTPPGRFALNEWRLA